MFLKAVLVGVVVGSIYVGALHVTPHDSLSQPSSLDVTTAVGHGEYRDVGVQYLQGGEDNTGRMLQPAYRQHIQ